MTVPTVNVVFLLNAWIRILLECLNVRKSQCLIDTYLPPQHLLLVLSPLLLCPTLLCPCGCSGCVMLLRCHIPPRPVPVSSLNSTDAGEGKKERKEGAEGPNWQRWQTERRQERVARWDHRSCDAMEMPVAWTQALHDNFELKTYKHNMADVYRLFELEYNLRGYGLISSAYSDGSVYKHGEAEITKRLKWGSVIVVRKRGRGLSTSFLSAALVEEIVVCFTAELLTFK